MSCSMKPVHGSVIGGPARQNCVSGRCRYVAYKMEWIMLKLKATPLSGASRQRGFTLVELLATITVLVILSSIAAASFSSTVSNNRMYSAQNEFVASLQLPRSEPPRRGLPVMLSATAPVTGNAFGGGWTVWVDTNGNGSVDFGGPPPSRPPGLAPPL